jgi:hypothetical protein
MMVRRTHGTGEDSASVMLVSRRLESSEAIEWKVVQKIRHPRKVRFAFRVSVKVHRSRLTWKLRIVEDFIM